MMEHAARGMDFVRRLQEEKLNCGMEIFLDEKARRRSDERDVPRREILGEVPDSLGNHDLAQIGKSGHIGVRPFEVDKADALVGEKLSDDGSIRAREHAGAIDLSA